VILAYIAGPFTALLPDGAPDLPRIEINIRAAEDVARIIITRSERIACLVPHSIGRYFAEGPGSPDYWYAATMEMANRCDCAMMAPGWERSSGSKREKARMEQIGRPVFTDVDELIRWVER